MFQLKDYKKLQNIFQKLLIDFIEAGNVDTSVSKEVDSKNILVGLSGKKFKIPKKWINPSGKWHLGLKALFKPNIVKASEKLPEFDCIVWFNGQKWCACIETYGTTDLEKAKTLTNFCDEHEYVQNNGNLLEIFTTYDHHGSVVAQIAAANFLKNPEQNGLAPGAQIISMNVLDPEEGYSLGQKNAKAKANRKTVNA